MAGEEIQRLVDIEDICQLRARWTRMLDTKDWDGYGELVVDECRVIGDGGTRTSRREIVDSLRTALADATTVHQVHTPEIDVTGDTATGRWAMQDIVTFQLPGEEPYTRRGYGWYLEEYVRTSDGWRLASSQLQRQRVDTEGELPASFRQTQ